MLEITWEHDDNLALAVSTGIDSMSLLHLLNTTYKHTYQKLICLHVNHGLRKESQDEANFIEEFCEEHNIEIYIKTLDLSDVVQQNKSIQDVSRNIRYEWFDQIMKETNSTILLTAHHLDDQKETIAYRLFSGRIGRSSLGISKNQTRNGYKIIRPFLNISKSELRQYQHETQFTYFEDQSNQDTKYTRNYIRNNILPIVDERDELSTSHLVTLNQWMDDARDLVNQQAQMFINKEVVQGSKIVIDRHKFNDLNPLIKIQILDNLLGKYVQRQFSMKACQEWLDIFHNQKKQSVIPVSDDWQFIVAYDKLLLCKDIEFNVNSIYIDNDEQFIFGNWVIEAKRLSSPLFVRTREPGDRIQYYNRGNKQHKKVNRIMIDNKMDIHKRDYCPIIVNEDDIVAIGDIWIDSNFKNVLTITYIGDDF
ncbi:tRNA lysidine(34) synthetase TilS [Mammaliicoccus sp. JADD-157]|uniref:tRNA lysidine(34) synthetase TilS n=1 Tax=Mammaliicoccus sp. JADD-157 TaxID=3404818 RepID=UPI003BB716EF